MDDEDHKLPTTEDINLEMGRASICKNNKKEEEEEEEDLYALTTFRHQNAHYELLREMNV